MDCRVCIDGLCFDIEFRIWIAEFGLYGMFMQVFWIWITEFTIFFFFLKIL
jgi:hypothetical protein